MRHRCRAGETSRGDSLRQDRRCVWITSEPPHLRRRALQEKLPHSRSSVRARQRAMDVEHQIAKGLAWSHQIVVWKERTRQASTRLQSEDIQPDFSALARGPNYRAE